MENSHKKAQEFKDRGPSGAQDKSDMFNGYHKKFLDSLIEIQCLLAGAEGGAIFQIEEDRVNVLSVYPQVNSGAPAPAWLVQSAKFISDALYSDTIVIRQLEGSTSSGSSSEVSHVFLVPLKLAEMDYVSAVFVARAADEKDIKAISRTLQLSADQLTLSEKYLPAQGTQINSQQLKQALEVLSIVNREDNFKRAAIALCNEVAAQWRCERVSIGFLQGRYVQVKAMSHAENFSRKMKLIQDMESAMEECLDQNVEILSPVPEKAGYVSRATDHFSKAYGSLTILSLPLRRDEKVFAVVLLERNADRVFTLDEIEAIRLACELCSARLNDLHRNDRWFGPAIMARTADLVSNSSDPKYSWAKITAILCAAVLLFLLFAKGDFRAEAPFIFQASNQRSVPAPFDGYIKNVKVDINDTVEAGVTIFAQLDTSELQLQLRAEEAEKVGYIKQAKTAMREGETAEAQIAQANADKLSARIDLMNYQINHASLVSPISGLVVTGDLKKEIGKPVKTGDVLFEVCTLDSLYAELMMNEEDIHDVETGQEGLLATASFPEEQIEFVVERINPMAEVVNQRNVFKVCTRLIGTHSWTRPGMEGIAKVSIGERRYIWIWSRKITNWVRMKMWI